jgi:TonB-linked SusC/RagA family outer membrane protein
MKASILVCLVFLFFIPIVEAQRANMNVKNESLIKVMTSIRLQTSYSFSLPFDWYKDAKPVTVKLKNAELKTMLDIIFADQPFRAKLDNRTIVVSRREAAHAVHVEAKEYNDTTTITGVVYDDLDLPLAGATIEVATCNNKGALTDVDGKFVINSLPSKGKLNIRHVGYHSVNLSYDGPANLTINLVPANISLKGVVFKGYYSTSQALNTGSVGMIRGESLRGHPGADPVEGLNGKVPGLFVRQTSGLPGATLDIMLRGQLSLINGNTPLIVIDNLPQTDLPVTQTNTAAGGFSPTAGIPAAFIELIEVLRDADATAIYGSRGANGVILITTKRNRPDGTRCHAEIHQGTGKVARRLPFLNAPQFLMMRREALRNDGSPVKPTDYDLNGIWDTSATRNLQDLLIGGTAYVTNIYAGMTGGQKQTLFSFDASFCREGTVYPRDHAIINGAMRGHLSHTSKDARFNMQLDANFSYTANDLPQNDPAKNLNGAPFDIELYDSSGNLNWMDGKYWNPLSPLYQSSKTTITYLRGIMLMSYELPKNFTLKSTFGYNTTLLDETALTPYSSVMPIGGSAAEQRMYKNGLNNMQSWICEPQINYHVTEKNSQLDVLLGATIQTSTNKETFIDASGFPSDALINQPGMADSITTYLRNDNYMYQGYFVRLGYNMHDRYIVNFTGRTDGSSKFVRDKRWGAFWALGAAWIFSKEPFMDSLDSVITFAKLRGSFGVTGSDQLPYEAFRTTYVRRTGYGGAKEYPPGQLASASSSWETMQKSELALEMRFFDRCFLQVSAYRNMTRNQLVAIPLSSTGATEIFDNVAVKVENKGWEFFLETDNIVTKSFNWNTSLTLTVPKNKLLKYPGLGSSKYRDRFSIGSSINSRYLFHYTGVDPYTGNYRFAQLDNDPSLDQRDKRPLSFDPDYYGSITNTINFRGLSFSAEVQYVKQPGYDHSRTATAGRLLLTGSNQLTNVLDRWQQPGNITQIQRFSGSSPDALNATDLLNQSDAVYVDASYIRLKNLYLGYILPAFLKGFLPVRQLSIYANVENLVTITSFKGLDPETQRFGIMPYLPPLRMFGAGLKISI